jgi:hypothetical protein
MGLRAMQDSVQPQNPRVRPYPVAAPTGGWNTRDSIAAMSPTDALVLDNWIVRPGQVTMRKGQQAWTTGFAGDVQSVMPWVGGAASKLFAATSAGIFDATTQGTVGGVATAATYGRWNYTNFSNSNAERLICVNGVDAYRYYDGTSWTTVPSFTFGSGTLSTNALNNVVAYNQRLFFCQNGSLDLFFLAIGAVSGTIYQFPLGQLCKRGGTLVALGTWTIDGGAGVNDLLVAATSEGEVIVYQGIDPTVAASWSLQGVYSVGAPLGPRALQKYGGDLLYLCARGLIPLSKLLQTSSLDRSVALSDKINSTFAAQATQQGASPGWDIVQHDLESFLFVNVPTSPPQQFVMDYQSKSWSRFVGFNALCWAYFNGAVYYGMPGQVVQAYVVMSDFGANIESSLRTSYNYFKSDSIKQLSMVRPSFSATGPFSYSMNCSTNFDVFGDISQTTFGSSTQSLWDASLWDSGMWTADYYLQNRWGGVTCWPFFALSLGIKLGVQGVLPSLISIDYALQPSANGIL